MLAFDLDGIFVPDIIYQPETFEMVHAVRTRLMRPIFIPEKPYYIITGRPVVDRVGTLHWIEAFAMGPERVFHENVDVENPVLYKEAVLREHTEITCYVESDERQAEYLRESVPGCTVMWFAELLRSSIYGGSAV